MSVFVHTYVTYCFTFVCAYVQYYQKYLVLYMYVRTYMYL